MSASNPVLHVLLNRVAEQTAQIEAVRALCEQRIEMTRTFLNPARVSAHDVLALLDGGDPDE